MSIRLRIEGRYGNRAVTIIAPDDPPALADIPATETEPAEDIEADQGGPSGLARVLQSIAGHGR